MTQPELSNLKELLGSVNICTISSINSAGNPSSATVAFAQDDDLNLVVSTSKLSRKAGNIQNKPDVSLVVTKQEELKTVQIEGRARFLEGDELAKYQEMLFTKIPFTAKFKDIPDQCWILIKPNWVRLTDISKNPWLVGELNQEDLKS